MITTYSTTRAAALSATTQIENTFIIEYMNNAPMEYTCVYLFALMQYQNPAFANDDIALALGTTDEEIIKAFQYWQDKGLIRIIRDDPLHIEFCGVKGYGASIDNNNAKYASMIKKLRSVLGTRVFTATDMRKVYDWIEVFGLDEDTVIELVKHCIDKKGNRVSVMYMDSIARAWADSGVLCADDARELIASDNEYTEAVREIKKRWRITRNITQDEIDLYKKWRTEWGLSSDVILEACSELVHASSPSFGYLNSVLESYKEKGIIDVVSIKAMRKERLIIEDFTKQLLLNAGLSIKPTSGMIMKVETWLNEWHITKEALILLSEEAKSYSKPFDFMSKTASKWHELGITSVASAKEYLQGNGKKTAKRTTGRYNNERKYTADDIKKLGINIVGGDSDDN